MFHRLVARSRGYALIVVLAAQLTGLAGIAPAHAIDIDAHPELRKVVDLLVNEDGFNREDLTRIFATANFKQKIVDSMKRPAERLKWHQYRPLFVTEPSARNGVAFMKLHQDVFDRAEAEFGVPATVIAAIIGVETRYGKVQGKHRILDSLTTLTVGYPRRSDFFAAELRAFMKLAREEGLDPLTTKGSYAGAMGIAQFISSSYRAYAIDYSGDGKRDLRGTPADAIGSVGNYLKNRGWVRGAPIITPVTLAANANPEAVVSKGRKTTSTVGGFAASGITFAAAASGDTKAGLVRLDAKSGTQYRGAFTNYFAIMTYNPSQMYAMAVAELSQEIDRYRN